MVKWEEGKVTFKLDDIESISDAMRSNVLPEKGIVQIGIIAGNKSQAFKDLTFEIEKMTIDLSRRMTSPADHFLVS